MSISATLSVIRLPMLQAFGHARATRDSTDNVIFQLDLGDASGLGECVPRDYVTGETTGSVCRAIIERLDMDLLAACAAGASFETCVRTLERLNLPTRMGTQQRPMPAAACAVELAMLDALGRRFCRPLFEIPAALDLPASMVRPATQRHSYQVSRVLDFSTLPDLSARLGSTHHAKIKVGTNIAHDVDRVRRIRDMLGPDIPISVDANMAWSMEGAVRMAEHLQASDIAWYEEPLRDNRLEQLCRFRELTGAAVMLDEAISSADDARRAIEAGACDLFNIRLSKCGGFLRSLRLAELALSNGLDFQIGVQVGEAGPLWAAGRHFVSAIQGAVAYEAGRGDRLFRYPLIVPQPKIDLATYLAEPLPGPGLGVALVEEILARRTIQRYELGSHRRPWGPISTSASAAGDVGHEPAPEHHGQGSWTENEERSPVTPVGRSLHVASE